MSQEAWEYRRETLGGLFRAFDIEYRVFELMNRLGTEGWELAAQDRSWFTNRYRLVFKRRVQLGASQVRAA
jgi:hypothetical protein